jgi:DNA-binding MarR family transcriptional regulator
MISNKRIAKGFGMVSSDIIRNPDFSLQEKALYAYLSSYADGLTNEVFVSVNRMCAECNITQSTVKRILSSLEKKGVILRENRGSKVTRKTTLLK